MRDVSVGGALLETEPLPLGEEIRVEIEGEYSAFTMDAVVIRSCLGPGGEGSVGIRFVDRDPSSYAEWLENECVRLSTWMCREDAPLIATRDPLIPEGLNDPALVPVFVVFQIIESKPGTSFRDLLGLLGKEDFDRIYLRIAVARLIQSRALAVMEPARDEEALPSPARLLKRISESLWSIGVKRRLRLSSEAPWSD